MDNLWAFLLQTLNASAVALLLLLLKTMLADKLSPRWQYGIWAVLAAVLLLPANLLGRHGLLNLALWVEAGKTVVEGGLSSAFSGPYAPTAITLPLPLWPGGSPQSVTDWLFCLYAIGVLLLLAHYLLAYLRLRRLLNRAPPAGVAQVERVAQAYGLKGCRSVAVDGLTSAFVCGVFRPILALPAGTATDDKVILHELLHLKHGDVFLGWLTCLFRCLHWCNPFLWFVFHRMGNDCEALCDQRVLERLEGEERRAYGTILLSMANEKYARAPGTSSAANGGRNIALRIASIARFKRYPAGMGLVSVCIGIVLLSACLPTSLAARPYFTPAGRPWSLALSMASARTTRCTTLAGALDTYAKGLLTENGIYLAMACPLADHAALVQEMEAHEGMSYYHLPFEPLQQFPVPYYVYNLSPDGTGGYTALLVFPQSAEGRAGYFIAVPVSVIREGMDWVVQAGEVERFSSNAHPYTDDFTYVARYGDPALPPLLTYVGGQGDCHLELVTQSIHTAQANPTVKDFGFFPASLDLQPNPHAHWNSIYISNELTLTAPQLQVGHSVAVRANPVYQDGTTAEHPARWERMEIPQDWKGSSIHLGSYGFPIKEGSLSQLLYPGWQVDVNFGAVVLEEVVLIPDQDALARARAWPTSSGRVILLPKQEVPHG